MIVGAVCRTPLPSLVPVVVLLLLLRWPSLLPLLSQMLLLPPQSLLMLWCVLLLESAAIARPWTCKL